MVVVQYVDIKMTATYILISNNGGKKMKVYEMMRQSDNTIFFINKHIDRYGNITYQILKDEGYYITDAMLYDDDIFLWESVSPFNCIGKTIVFLKNNIENLI